MDVPVDLYNRLSEEDTRILPPDIEMQPNTDKVTLTKNDAQQMENGLVAGLYLLKMAENGLMDGLDLDFKGLQQLKNSNNPTAKLHNWNIIVKQLQKMDVSVDSDEKSLLVAGDHDSIISLLLKLYQIELEINLAKESAGGVGANPSQERFQEHESQGVPESPSKLSILKEAKPEPPISILEIKGDKPLTSTRTTLEFVIVSLCKSLQVTPNQAAGLLTNHNYYLMHACVKGIKGDHEPILRWYDVLFESCEHLVELAVESLPNPDDENTSLNDSQITDEDCQPLFILLGALKCGFYSDYFGVSNKAFKLFWKISADLNQHGYQKVFAKWLFQQPDADNAKLGGGLEATLYMLNKHSQIVESVALLLISSFKGSFELLIPEIRDNQIRDDIPRLYTLIGDLLPFLHKHHREEVTAKLLAETTLIEDLLRQADTTRYQDNNVKSACLSLLAEIWSLEPTLINDNSKRLRGGVSVLDECLKVFKNTCKFSSKALKVSTIGLMFKLLDQFATTRNSQAPVIYKLLVFAIVENIDDEEIKEFMMTSFISVFKDHSTIPVSILAEPLLRLAQINDKRYRLNVADFSFFTMVARHPKLQQPLALQILDQFAKVFITSPIWASSAAVPIFIIAERFKEDPQLQGFMLKFASLAINSVLELHKRERPSSQAMANPNGRFAKRPAPGELEATYYEEVTLRRLKLASIIKVVERLVNMKLPILAREGDSDQLPLDVNDEIRSAILSTNRRYHQLHGQFNKGLLYLLELWHSFDALKVMQDYKDDMDEYEKPQIDEEEIATMIKKETSRIHEESQRFILQDDQQTHLSDQEEYYRILPTETRNSELSSHARQKINQSQVSGQGAAQQQQLVVVRDGSGMRGESQNGQRQLALYDSKQALHSGAPKPPANKRVNVLAQRNLEAIKSRRDEKFVQQQLEEERRRLQIERNIKKAKEEVQKRKLELGVMRGVQETERQVVIYDPSSALVDDHNDFNPKRHSLPVQKQTPAGINKHIEGLKLVDWETEEEDRDRDGVRILLSKYNKVFKFLFNKYALSSVQYQRVQKFEINGDKVINVAEICKFLRDHELLTSVAQSAASVGESGVLKISKDQIAAIVRLLNIKNNNRNDTQSLGFAGFIELMPQLAAFCWQRHPGGMKELLQHMIEHNERVTKAKGQSTILYEDPDHTTIGDQDILRELNRKVKDNPDYILPEGYYKVQEKEQVMRHSLPETLPIKESQRVAIEVLDGILSDKLGIHILEAIVTYESRYKVRPRIKHAPGMVKKEEGGSAPALGFMKAAEKKARDPSVLKNLSNLSTSPKAVKAVQGIQLAPIVLENVKDPFIKPKLGVDLKLETIKLQQERPLDKALIQETAEILEEILQAADQGLQSLPERQKAQAKEELKNKVQEDKEAKAKQDKLLEKQREELRKKRHQALQEEIEKKKQEKLKQEEELKLQKEAAEKEKKDKAKRDVSQAKQKDDQKRKLIEEARRKKEEEAAKKKAEEEDKRLAEKLRKQQETKDFFKRQKQQLEQEFVKRHQEQEEAERIKLEMEHAKRALQEQVKAKMVNFMRQNKEQQRNEQAEWEQINAFYAETDTQGVFAKYEKALGKLFRHFAALDKKDMNLHSMQRISLQEFTKFGFQNKLVPRVVTNEDFTLIFRALIREKTSTMTEKELDELGLGVNTLGLEEFKKALIRIAILGQNRLPEDEWLLYKLPEWQAENSQSGPKSVPQSTTNRVQKQIKIRGRSTLNSQGSQRRLVKQGSTAAIENEEGAGEASQTDIHNPAAKKSSVVRKTKEQKLIEELGKAKERQEKLGQIKIEDKKLNKAFDVSLVNSHTIDALLQYLQLQPNPHADGAAQHDKTHGDTTAQQPEGEEAIQEYEPYEGGVYDGEGNPINQGDDQQATESHKDEHERQAFNNIVGPDGEIEQWKMVE